MKRIILLSSLILFIVSIISSCRPPELEGAFVDYKAGRMENALKLAKESTEKYPTNPEAWYLLGDIYGQQGDYDKMIESFNKSLELSKQFETQITNQRNFYYTDAFNRAVNNYNTYVKAPDKSDEKAIKVLDQAISDFQKAALVKDTFQPNQLLAVCYSLKGDSVNTIKAYDKLTKVAPDSVSAWLHYGNFYLTHSNFKEATKYLEKAYELDNNNSDVIASLSQAYDFAGDKDKAIVLYDKAVELNPEEKAFPFNLGLLYYKQSIKEGISDADKKTALQKCIDNFARVIELAPDSDEDFIKQAYEIKSSAEIQLEKYSDAQATLERAIELFPETGTLYYNLGIVYGRLGQKDKSKEAFAKAEELGY
jgi:tetratricopeptide (TPR) repeat protein